MVGPVLHIEVDIGAVGICSVGCSGKFHLCGQLASLLQPLLQILLGIVQGRAAIVLSRPDGRSPHPRRHALKAFAHFGSLFRGGIGNRHRAEFGSSIEAHHEPHIGDIVRGVQVYLGTNLGLKIAFLLEEAKQRVGVFLDIARIVRAPAEDNLRFAPAWNRETSPLQETRKFQTRPPALRSAAPGPRLPRDRLAAALRSNLPALFRVAML